MEQASPLFGNLMRGVAMPDYAFQSAHVKKIATIAKTYKLAIDE